MATEQNTEKLRNEEIQEGDVSSGKKTLKELMEILRHPFVLLVVGATITSLLVPYLNSKTTRNQLLQEARQKKAIEIRQRNIEFTSKLNALKTMCEQFHAMNVRLQPKPAELRQLQLKFVDDFTKRYLDFDERAWWWISGLQGELSTLHLSSKSELKTLDNEFKQYGENCFESKETLRPLWVALTAADYNPNDKEGKVQKIIANVGTDLVRLHGSRNDLVERIAEHFN